MRRHCARSRDERWELCQAIFVREPTKKKEDEVKSRREAGKKAAGNGTMQANSTDKREAWAKLSVSFNGDGAVLFCTAVDGNLPGSQLRFSQIHIHREKHGQFD